MNADELRAIISYLENKVTLSPHKFEEKIVIDFKAPSPKEMIDAGLNVDGVHQILNSSWWEDMVQDIVETPEMCGDDEAPEQVLEFARDVVSEYIRKRFTIDGN